MRRSGVIIAALATTALAVTVAIAGAGRAAALPSYASACTSCHASASSGVTASPGTATPAAGAPYSVSVGVALTASGATGYWIADSTSTGTTGSSTGVFGGPGSQTTWTATMTAPSTPGTYYYKVFAAKGYRGQAGSALYSITVPSSGPSPTPTPTPTPTPAPTPAADIVAPTTAQSGADDRWHSDAVLVTLSARDNAGGTGVAGTESSLDGGVTWRPGTGVLVFADPLSHSSDGVHTVLFRSTDFAGNVEAAQTCQVKIDTSAPTPAAQQLPSVRHGSSASLRYVVADASPNGGTAAVVVLVRRPNGTVVKRIALARVAVNTPQIVRFSCPKRPGAFRVVLSAMDAAGNPGTRSAVVRLAVR